MKTWLLSDKSSLNPINRNRFHFFFENFITGKREEWIISKVIVIESKIK